MNSIVRRGTIYDTAPMMALLREMAQENALAPMDDKKVLDTLMRGLTGNGAIVGVIRGQGGVIEASVGLFVSSWWYSNERHVEDLWSFVSEPYRKSEHAKALLLWAKHAAEMLDQPLLMGVLSSDRTKAKVRLYERQLGAAVGAIFVVRQPASAA